MGKNQSGFTLVELAIVLVVIGLILGMAFKGKDLIDSAKVKSLAAQYNKIIAAVNIHYEKYGRYPGDGCTGATDTACTGTKNGVIENGNEAAAFWNELQSKGILTSADRKSVFGQDWTVWSNANQTWLDFTGGQNADGRMVCQLDKMIDDGDSRTGVVIDGDYAGAGVAPTNPGLSAPYTKDTDCWSLTGQANLGMRILP